MKKALSTGAVGLTLAALLAGCGGSSSSSSPATTSPATTPAAGTPRVLPVATNPIADTSKAPGLAITKALVENNVSPDSGKAVVDHLEVALRNTSAKPLSQIAVYYKISDLAKGVSEGYYTKLDGVTIAPGATRVVHFDNTNATDHYPVNIYSLYYTDKNALVIDVMASSPTAKPATFAIKKDAGGAEAGVE